MSENLTGSATAVFPVRLSAVSSDLVEVQWNTADGTAKGGTDYKPASGKLTFLPGETEKQIEVIVYGQPIVPADDKIFFIKLAPPKNAILMDSLLTCRINIEDSGATPVLEIIVAEGPRGQKGEPGMSSYDLAVFMGEFTGTVQEWMDKEANAGKAADRAEAAAVAANIGGKVYSTPNAGVHPSTGVSNGSYFNVRSPNSAYYVDEYLNVNGVATPTGKSYPSAKGLEDAIDAAEHSAALAEAAAVSAAIGSGIYQIPEAGVNPAGGVPVGSYYNVRSSVSEHYVDEYRNVAGSPVATGKSYLSAYGTEQQAKPASTIFDSVSERNQQDKNSDSLQLKDYAKYKVGNDWTAAIQRADNDALAQSKCVYVGGGTYNYSANITIQAHWFGSGRMNTRFKKTSPATITILKGGMTDITVSADALIPGDASDGVVVDGLDRKDIHELWSEYHGGDGVVYKRGNLSRFVVRGRNNNGRGVTLLRDAISGDNKACEFFIEANANGLSGVYMDQSPIAFQTTSSHNGTIRAQNNGYRAVSGDDYDVVLTGRGHDLNVYCEYGNKSVWLRDGLQASRIWFSNMSHVTLLDECDDTNVYSYIPSALGTRVTKNEKFEKWTIQKENASYSGKLALTHAANNTFRFEATLSGAQQYLELPANLTLRGASNSYQFAKAMQGGATLNFSTVLAQGMVERTVTVPGAVTSQQTAVIASPAGNVGNGLVWLAYVSAFDATANTTTVTIRVVNPTAAAITSIQLAWRVQVIT